ncbi:MAG: hypothetical protein ACK41E_08970 [Deinococcales bacterium]
MPRTHAERIPLGGSSGLESRGFALREYLGSLHAALEDGLGFAFAPVRLLVLSNADWASANKYPYGFTFFRRLRDGTGIIFAPADYPQRLLWVFRIIQANATQKPSSSLEMFFDLTLGHELGHAAAEQLGIRTHVRWLDEFLATYLYLMALKSTLPQSLDIALEWGQVLANSNLHCALADVALQKPSHSKNAKRRKQQNLETSTPRHDLGAFEYPLVRLPLANQAWYQARFTLFAAQLLERHGWGFVVRLREVLPNAETRGAVSRALVRLEPSFKGWFASFGG